MKLLAAVIGGTFLVAAVAVLWAEWAELRDYLRDHSKTVEVIR